MYIGVPIHCGIREAKDYYYYYYYIANQRRFYSTDSSSFGIDAKADAVIHSDRGVYCRRRSCVPVASDKNRLNGSSQSDTPE